MPLADDMLYDLHVAHGTQLADEVADAIRRLALTLHNMLHA